MKTELLAIVGGIALALLGWFLGKKKEDIEIALKYKEFYTGHINDLSIRIKELESSVDKLVSQGLQKDAIIEELKKNRDRWEAAYIRMEGIAKDKDKLISQLYKESDDASRD